MKFATTKKCLRTPLYMGCVLVVSQSLLTNNLLASVLEFYNKTQDDTGIIFYNKTQDHILCKVISTDKKVVTFSDMMKPGDSWELKIGKDLDYCFWNKNCSAYCKYSPGHNIYTAEAEMTREWMEHNYNVVPVEGSKDGLKFEEVDNVKKK